MFHNTIDKFLPIINQFPYAGIFILIIIGALGLPLPEDSILILCGFLIYNKVMKIVPALLVIYLSLLIGDFVIYAFGRKFGRKIVTHRKFQKIISPERLSWLEAKFHKSRIFVIMIGRHILGLRSQIFITAGVMRMPIWEFLLVDAISSTFTIALMVGAGYLGGNSLRIITKDFSRLEHLLIFVLILALAGFLVYKFFKPSQVNSKKLPDSAE